jgi:hypothetical protein
MSITVSTKTYTADRTSPDAIVYAGPSHTISNSDIIEMKRVYPKATKDFAGVARPSIKISRTVTLADASKATAILSITGSLPVGTADSDLNSLIADCVDVLQLEEAGTTKICKNLDITY